MKYLLRRYLLLLLCLLAAGLAAAKEVPDPNPGAGAPLPGRSAAAGTVPSARAEAPEALFELDIGDAEVDFYLEGSWQASLFGSLGFLVDPAGALIWQAFPGWESVPVFKQIPDLTFSVWLMQRYFLEASVVGDFLAEDYDFFDRNYILAGYRGGEEEFLRQLLIGNRDIGIGTYPFIEVPAAGGSSLGASALLATGISSHELLLRFDNNEQDRIVFIGKNRVSEQTIPLNGYQRGRFFRLPDAAVEGLEVYLEDPDGAYTGTDAGGHDRRYRLATADDAAVDAAAGTVTLNEPAEGSVLVYYTKGGLPVGHASLGGEGLPGEAGLELDPTATRDFDFEPGTISLGQLMTARRVSLGGNDCLRLFEPGEFSPFEILGAYALEGKVPEELSRLRVSVVRKGASSLAAIDPPRPRLTPGADYLALEYGTGNKYRRVFYPFLDALDASPRFDADNRLYGPLADAPAGYLDYEILVSHLTPVSDYRIGTDMVPGSVQVLRNGQGETRFEVDYEQGLLTFLTEIAPNDRVEVHFRRQLSLANNGDLLFAWGNTIAASEALSVQVAVGLRWNLLPGGFTEEAYSRTGSVILSAGAEGRAGPLSYRATAGLSFTNPDTTGTMRLLGMEETGLDVALSEDTAWPAAPPADDGPFGASTLDRGNRGRLLYKDYRSYGLLGSSALMPYTWTPPADQIWPYDTGSKPGPYVAAGSADGDNSGRSLVLDLDLDDGEWVGAQLPVLPEPGPADLSAYQGISLRYRMVDLQRTGAAACTVYLQLGEVGEDLDGDGGLDEELSASAAGFSFDDSANAAVLRVGSGPKNTGNARRDSEDVDGNGVPDADGDAWIVTLTDPNGAMTANRDWTVLQHSFSAAERAQLRRSRSLRLLVVETGVVAGTVSGRLLVDRISLQGSPFSVETTGAVTATARELEEQLLSSPPPQSLTQTHPEVAEVFHPFGERQKVLAIDWQGGNPLTDSWQVKGYVGAFTEGIDYRNIVYYYHLPTADGDELYFQLRDAGGGGVSWTLPATSTAGWAKVRVSLDDGQVYRNEQAVSTASGTLKGASIAVFTVALDAVSAGSLYLDELHLTDPQGAVGGGALVDLQLSLPGELLSVGGYPLLRDLSLRQEVAASTAGFSSLYGTPAPEGSLSSRTELAVGVSVVDLRADFTVRAVAQEVDLGGGHRLALPGGSFPVQFSDAFRLEQRAAGPELGRGNTLSLDLPPLFALDLEAAAAALEGTLSQRWLAEVLLTPGPVRLDNRLELSAAARGFALPDASGGYLANWLQGYGLLAPWQEGEPLERKGTASLGWSVQTAPVGFDLLGSYGFHSFDLADPSRSLRGNLALDVSLPLTWRDGTVTRLVVAPGYRRSLALRGSEAGGGDFGGDLASASAWLFAQAYAFGGPPFGEFYAPATAASFEAQTASFTEAAFEAEGYLRLSRRVSSRLVDLLLPATLEMALGRSLLRAGDLTSDYNRYTLKAQGAALNLFGAYGAYPLFAFYRTDEFSSSFTLSLRTQEGRPVDGEILLENYISFEEQSGNQLTVRNRFFGEYESAWTTTDRLELLYTWEQRPPEGVRLPLLPPSVGQEGYWSHQESLGLDSDGPREDASFHPVTLILGHESSLVLPEHGLIKASLGLGFDLEETQAEDLYTRFGLRGGVEVRIEF